MAIYEFECSIHGRFEKRMGEMVNALECPICTIASPKVVSVTAPHVWKMSVHTDSGIPTNIHNTLTYKNSDQFEYISKKQGKVIHPEDM